MRFVHFYPFNPSLSHGGTLRLETARRATAGLGETNVVWFDSGSRTWTTSNPKLPVPSSPASGWKRRVFPSTLFESGRNPVRALTRQGLPEFGDGILVLHTTYLAAAIPEGAFLDVYDLVWRAHEIDSRNAYRTVRRTYAATVRLREHRALRKARGLPVAGWSDFQDVRHLAPAAWCPTGLPQVTVPTRRPPNDVLRIGFLGNFAHRATLDSARALLRSPAAASPSVEVVLGGWASNEHPELAGAGVRIAGPVPTPGEFWADIDCAVIPVTSGTGMKVKIAEAVLAGRAVVTTPLGAIGFAPEHRSSMAVVGDVAELHESTCRNALARRDAAPSQPFALTRAVEKYRAFLRGCL